MKRNVKTPTLALIDDGIHHSCVTADQPFESYIADEYGVIQGMVPEGYGTHALACYNMFKKNIRVPYRLISIKVINHETGTGLKKSLLSALHWCAQHDIDIISMSMGTRQHSDFAQVSKAVNALSKTIIVAACNNQNTLTYPACLPNVIGARHYKEKTLRDRFAYIPNPYDQIELVTCAEDASNSMAVPIVTAHVCEYIAKGFSGLRVIKQKLKEDAVQDISFVNYDFYKNLLPEWEEIQIPIVVLPDDIPEGIDKLKHLVAVFVENGYRAAILSQNHKTCVANHIFSLSWQGAQAYLLDLIKLYHNFILPDILFLHIKREHICSIEADIVIEPGWFNESVQHLFWQIKEKFS